MANKTCRSNIDLSKETDGCCDICPTASTKVDKTTTLTEELVVQGLKVYNMTWQGFEIDVYGGKDTDKFDFLIYEPPAAPSRSFLK